MIVKCKERGQKYTFLHSLIGCNTVTAAVYIACTYCNRAARNVCANVIPVQL